MTLKENLRFLRKKAGLTQAELAKKLHIKQYNVSDYEIGRIEPSIPMLIKFADYYKVSVDYLIGHREKVEKTQATESDINAYVDEMRIDKYLMKIYADIKDLDPDNKKKATDILHFTVLNILD